MDIPNSTSSTREKVEALRARFVASPRGAVGAAGAKEAQAQALGIERAPVGVQGVNPYGLSTTKGRAYDMLSKGMGTLAVARVLDVDPSLVSQYLGEEEFRKGVGAALQARALARTARDEKIEYLLPEHVVCERFVVLPVINIKNIPTFHYFLRMGDYFIGDLNGTGFGEIHYD